MIDQTTINITNVVEQAFTTRFGADKVKFVSAFPTRHEEWYAVVHFDPQGSATYRAQVGDGMNEDNVLDFELLTHDGRSLWPTCRVEIPDEVYQEHGSEFANTQGETQASPAWQLLEIANDDLAERLIEHHKMSAEIETITADEIMDLISQMGGKG